MNSASIGELVSQVSRHGPDPSANEFVYVDLSSVDATTKRITSPSVVPVSEAPSRAKQNLAADDVLVSTVRPNLNGVGFVWPEHHGSVGSTGFSVLRARHEVLNPRYLFHWVRSPTFIEVMTRLATGASYPAVTDAIVKSSEIPLPPLPEQRRIAAILDEADALRSASGRKGGLLRELIDAHFDSATRSLTTSTTTIGELIESSQYGTSAKAGGEGEFPILRMGNVTTDGRIDLTDMKYIDLPERDHAKYLVRHGDVLFNRTNSADLVGKTAVYREAQSRAFAGYLVRLRPTSPELGEYIAAYLNSRHGKLTLRKMAKSIVGMANINAQEAKSIRLPDPTPDLLKSISTLRGTIDAERRTSERRTDHLDELFASLQHRAFRGEL